MYAYAYRTLCSVSAPPILPSIDNAMSANPFSDSYATVEDSASPPSYAEHARDGKMIDFPETIPVPFIDAVSPMRSFASESNGSSMSTTPSTPPKATAYGKIDWTNADMSMCLPKHYKSATI
jgi:hypothetical protein